MGTYWFGGTVLHLSAADTYHLVSPSITRNLMIEHCVEYRGSTAYEKNQWLRGDLKMKSRSASIACAAQLILLCYCQLGAQTVEHPLIFDAASVKQANPSLPDGRTVVGMLPPTGGPGTSDPGRIHYPIVSLEALIRSAYQLKPEEKIIGPSWLDTDFFQVDAVMPSDATIDQFREMLRNLLADRFELKVHRAEKGSPIWAMVLAKNGPRMKVSAEQKVDAPLPPGAFAVAPDRSAPHLGADGFPLRPNVPASGAGLFTSIGTLGIRLTARQQTMHDLADVLSKFSRRLVLDETGLTSKYDFILTFTTRPDVDSIPDIFTSIRSLGIRLQSETGSVALLVIDHVNKNPTPN